MVARRQATWVEKSIRVFLVSLILVTLAAGLVAYWGTVQAQGAEFAAGDDVTVDTDFLNFRAGAGLSFSVIVVLKRGIELKVVAGPTAANGYTWYEVRTKTNASGWVAGEYLALEKTWTDFAVGDLALVDAQALNCRSGPGLNAGVIYVMEGGTQVTILDGPNTVDGYHWYKVETDDGDIGWAVGEFLRIDPNGWPEEGGA